jgi:hypothetical protein
LRARPPISASRYTYNVPPRRKPPNTGVDTERRTLATRAISAFFAAPLAGDRGRIKLVVDNDR